MMRHFSLSQYMNTFQQMAFQPSDNAFLISVKQLLFPHHFRLTNFLLPGAVCENLLQHIPDPVHLSTESAKTPAPVYP